MHSLRKTLFVGFASIALLSSAMVEARADCRVDFASLYVKMGLNDSKLSAEQAAIFSKIRGVFEKDIRDRLEGLPPEVRSEVSQKLNELEVISGGDIGNWDTRGVVITTKGVMSINGKLRKIGKAELGTVFLNRKLEGNLYGLITASHEMEHVIDVATIKNIPMGRLRDSLRVRPFVLRTETDAFDASYAFFQKLKAAGVTFDDFISVMLSQSSSFHGSQTMYKETLSQVAKTGYGPSWMAGHDDLLDVVRLDQMSRDQYVATRLAGYDAKISDEQMKVLGRWAGITAVAGALAYGGATQLQVGEVAKKLFSNEVTGRSPTLAQPITRANEYRSEPGMWDESYYKKNGIKLERNLALISECETQAKLEAGSYSVLPSLENGELAIRYGASASQTPHVRGTTLMVLDSNGKPVFHSTTQGLVSGTTTVEVPVGTDLRRYRVQMCTHRSDGTTVFASQTVSVP